jgi:hypothetical protein
MEANYILFIVPTKQDDNTGQNNVADHASELKNEPMPLKRNCEKFYNLSESKELEELQESSARVLESLDSRNHALVHHSLIDAITAARESGQQKVVGELHNALKKIRQSASGAAKAAALDVLSRHGGCQLHDKRQVEDFDVDNDAASNSDIEFLPS